LLGLVHCMLNVTSALGLVLTWNVLHRLAWQLQHLLGVSDGDVLQQRQQRHLAGRAAQALVQQLALEGSVAVLGGKAGLCEGPDLEDRRGRGRQAGRTKGGRESGRRVCYQADRRVEMWRKGWQASGLNFTVRVLAQLAG